MAKQAPLLAIRPKFDPALTMVEAVPAGIAGAAISTFLIATFLFIALNLIGLGRFVSIAGLYGLFFILGLALTPAAYFEAKKFAYKNTFYAFYDDWLEYQDFKFFITRRRSRVRLRDITDVFERASPLQARRVLTSLYLVVPGMNFTAQQRGLFSGLKILDVPENSGFREKIIQLCDDSARRAFQQPVPPPQSPPAPVAADAVHQA